jgi:hypothetical protein
MSAGHTYTAQAERFAELDLVTRERELLRDVDCFADAEAVAAQIPGSRFAAVLASLPRPAG